MTKQEIYNKYKRKSLFENLQHKEDVLRIRRVNNALDYLNELESWGILLDVINEQLNEERFKKIKKLKRNLKNIKAK